MPVHRFLSRLPRLCARFPGVPRPPSFVPSFPPLSFPPRGSCPGFVFLLLPAAVVRVSSFCCSPRQSPGFRLFVSRPPFPAINVTYSLQITPSPKKFTFSFFALLLRKRPVCAAPSAVFRSFPLLSSSAFFRSGIYAKNRRENAAERSRQTTITKMATGNAYRVRRTPTEEKYRQMTYTNVSEDPISTDAHSPAALSGP